MKKNYTNLILIISIFVVILTASVFVFLFKVIENKNEHTSKTLTALSQKMADKRDTLILEAKFEELNSLNDKIDSYLIDKSQIDTFVSYLEGIGVSSGTELNVLNIDTLEKKENIITVKVSVLGNFSNILKTIYLIENIPYVVDLNQVFFNKDMKNISNNEGQEIVRSSSWQADVSFNVLSSK